MTDDSTLMDFGERVRGACLLAALHAHEEAGMRGLCAEGRWEAAVGAVQALDLGPLLRELRQSPTASTTKGTRDGKPAMG